MSAPSVTYTFSNSTTADASQVNQNFTDLINGVSDGTKDLSVNALTLAGALTANGNLTIGNASSDDFTVTASIASSIPIKTTFSYDLGSATIGWKSFYLGSNDSAAKSVRLIAGAIGTSWTLTLPTGVPATSGSRLVATTAGVTSWTAPASPTVQKFTTAASGTYTTAAGVLYLTVVMVGGGGGGAGSGSGSPGNGGTGATSTFGTALLSAVGGTGCVAGGGGATGGTASLGAAIGTALTGGTGAPISAGTNYDTGGIGGCTPLGGAGAGGQPGSVSGAGAAGAANTGSGGGGGSVNGFAVNAGGGGGASGYIYAIITSPSATYDYTVGAGGISGTAGTNGFAGAAGGSGYIEVREFYQ